MDAPKPDPWDGDAAWLWVVIIGAVAMAAIGRSNPFAWLMEITR